MISGTMKMISTSQGLSGSTARAIQVFARSSARQRPEPCDERRCIIEQLRLDEEEKRDDEPEDFFDLAHHNPFLSGGLRKYGLESVPAQRLIAYIWMERFSTAMAASFTASDMVGCA